MVHSPPFNIRERQIAMSLKQELQQLHNRLDSAQRKLDAAKGRGDQPMITKFTDEVDALSKKVNSLRGKQEYNVNQERKKPARYAVFHVRLPKLNKLTLVS